MQEVKDESIERSGDRSRHLVGFGTGRGLLPAGRTDAGAVLTVMQFVLLCALVFYAVLAVLALVKIAQNTDRGDR